MLKEEQPTPMPPVQLTTQQVLQNQEMVGLFPCSNEGCICVYKSYTALEKHIFFEECELQERAPLLDRAKTLSHHKLLEVARPVISSEYRPGETSATSSLTRDWALKTTKSSRRSNEAQRNYLGEKLQIGQHTGHKLDLTVVARNMRNAKKSDGTRFFQPDERRRHRSKLTFLGKPRHCATITMLTVTTKGLRERSNLLLYTPDGSPRDGTCSPGHQRSFESLWHGAPKQAQQA